MFLTLIVHTERDDMKRAEKKKLTMNKAKPGEKSETETGNYTSANIPYFL